METTIAAISTAMSASGIGIIRISGENAMDVISRIYRSKGGKKKIKEVPTHTIHYGYIYDGEELIDEVLVMIMHAPRTFTGEDTVEIDCHGGVYAMQRVLDTVLKNGAEIAEPGEFTKRASPGRSHRYSGRCSQSGALCAEPVWQPPRRTESYRRQVQVHHLCSMPRHGRQGQHHAGCSQPDRRRLAAWLGRAGHHRHHYQWQDE